MKTAKELAEAIRSPDMRAVDMVEVAMALDRLAAYERPLDDAELAEIERLHADVDGIQNHFGVNLEICHGHRSILLSALRRERAEKEALAQLVLAYRAADCPFSRPEQIDGLEKQDGHLAKESGK